MKRTYNKPVLKSETFVPNNYVAACVAENGETQFTIIQKAKDIGFDAIEFTDLTHPEGVDVFDFAKQ